MPFSWNDVAEKYARDPISDMAGYEAGLERVRAHLTPEMRVLEMGCGTGMTARRLAPSVTHIHGTDGAEAMIEIARRMAAAEGPPNLSFERMEIGGAALDGEPFDAVMAFNLLHLADDLGDAIANMRARVSRGGLAISKTPCLGRFAPLKPVVGAMRIMGKAPRVRFFRPATLERAFTAAGFEIVELWSQPGWLPRPLIVARLT